MNGRENKIFVLTVKSISLSSWTDTAPTPPFVCIACYELRLLEQGVGYTQGTTPPGRSCNEESVLTLKVLFSAQLSWKEADITLRSKAAVSVHEQKRNPYL